MATDNGVKVFEPNALKDEESILTYFNDFCESYQYTYEALNREPPSSVTLNEAKNAQREKDKKRYFLGKCSSRSLQIEFEQATAESERGNMNFKTMAL